MELSRFVKIIRRGWAIILVSTLLGLGVAAVTTLLTRPSYAATATLFVSAQSTGATDELQQGNIFSLSRVKSYVDVVRTSIVLKPAIQALELDISPSALARKIKAVAVPDTVILTIEASDPDPDRAAKIANAAGDALIEVADTLETPTNGHRSPVKITTLNQATAPSSPSSPQVLLNIVMGFLAGLAVGVIAALIRGVTDTRVRSEADLAWLKSIPLLGEVPFDAEVDDVPTITEPARDARAETYRQLRTNLRFVTVNQKKKSLLLTSSHEGEGTSLTAINLAIALAYDGQRVVLVDANLRRPAIARYLGLEDGAGLTSVLVGESKLEEVVRPWGSNGLSVVTSGAVPPNPSELLGSDATKKLIEALEKKYEVVIIDGPALLPVTDSVILSQSVGSVVVVIRSGAVSTKSISRAVSSLELVKAQVLGLILNRVPARFTDVPKQSRYRNEPLPAKDS